MTEPVRVLVKPVKRLFAKRQQWVFEVRAANGELIDPRETYNNKTDVVDILTMLFASYSAQPVELVVQDKFGNVETRHTLR